MELLKPLNIRNTLTETYMYNKQACRQKHKTNVAGLDLRKWKLGIPIHTQMTSISICMALDIGLSWGLRVHAKWRSACRTWQGPAPKNARAVKLIVKNISKYTKSEFQTNLGQISIYCFYVIFVKIGILGWIRL